MGNGKVLTRIQKEGKSFLNVCSEINETIYLVLLTLYILIYFIINIEWDDYIQPIISNIRYGLLSIVMWGATVYIFYIIATWRKLWKKTLLLIVIAAMMLLLTGYFSQTMSTNSYGVVMDLFFCITASGKNYRKMLKCILGVAVVMLFIAATGVSLGFTKDMVKPDNVHPGHSLGIIYPNIWGSLVYLTLLLLWYLYLRYKPIITFTLFWAMSAFLFFYVYSRTIALFTMIFPFATTIINYIQKRVDLKGNIILSEDNNIENKHLYEKNKFRNSLLEWVVVAIPFLSLFFVLFASMHMEWFHKHFYYTWFHNFAMRFVQGGFYLKTYGIPLFGNPYRPNVDTFMYINGEYLALGNLDSAFISYLIMRGAIWMIYTLAWLCLANWKALKAKDFAIPFLCTAILLFSMMERMGLEMWFNFILLYPLAKADANMQYHDTIHT